MTIKKRKKTNRGKEDKGEEGERRDLVQAGVEGGDGLLGEGLGAEPLEDATDFGLGDIGASVGLAALLLW